MNSTFSSSHCESLGEEGGDGTYYKQIRKKRNKVLNNHFFSAAYLSVLVLNLIILVFFGNFLFLCSFLNSILFFFHYWLTVLIVDVTNLKWVKEMGKK